MGLARAWSIGLHGVDGDLVEIEADIGLGLPGAVAGRAARRRPRRGA